MSSTVGLRSHEGQTTLAAVQIVVDICTLKDYRLWPKANVRVVGQHCASACCLRDVLPSRVWEVSVVVVAN